MSQGTCRKLICKCIHLGFARGKWLMAWPDTIFVGAQTFVATAFASNTWQVHAQHNMQIATTWLALHMVGKQWPDVAICEWPDRMAFLETCGFYKHNFAVEWQYIGPSHFNMLYSVWGCTLQPICRVGKALQHIVNWLVMNTKMKCVCKRHMFWLFF